MSTFRNVSDGPRSVFVGLHHPQTVEPDATVTVDSADDEAYECQTHYWQRVESSTPAFDSGRPTAPVHESSDPDDLTDPEGD